MFWNAFTENYFNASLLTVHTEYVSVQDKFSLYYSSSIKHYNDEQNSPFSTFTNSGDDDDDNNDDDGDDDDSGDDDDGDADDDADDGDDDIDDDDDELYLCQCI